MIKMFKFCLQASQFIGHMLFLTCLKKEIDFINKVSMARFLSLKHIFRDLQGQK